MRCHVCGSVMKPLVTNLPFKVSETSIVVLKGLPVLQCDNCSEYLLEDEVMERVEEIFQKVDSAAEVRSYPLRCINLRGLFRFYSSIKAENL